MRRSVRKRHARNWDAAPPPDADLLARVNGLEKRVKVLWDCAAMQLGQEEIRAGRQQLTLGRTSIVAGAAMTVIGAIIGSALTVTVVR